MEEPDGATRALEETATAEDPVGFTDGWPTAVLDWTTTGETRPEELADAVKEPDGAARALEETATGEDPVGFGDEGATTELDWTSLVEVPACAGVFEAAADETAVLLMMIFLGTWTSASLMLRLPTPMLSPLHSTRSEKVGLVCEAMKSALITAQLVSVVDDSWPLPMTWPAGLRTDSEQHSSSSPPPSMRQSTVKSYALPTLRLSTGCARVVSWSQSPTKVLGGVSYKF